MDTSIDHPHISPHNRDVQVLYACSDINNSFVTTSENEVPIPRWMGIKRVSGFGGFKLSLKTLLLYHCSTEKCVVFHEIRITDGRSVKAA